MKILCSLFPKLFRGISKEELADILTETGFEAVDLLLRDGYWVDMDNMAAGSEGFINFMNKKGIKVEFATTGFSPEMLCEHQEPLRILSEAGIKSFRMSYLFYDEEKEDFFSALEKGRTQMQRMAELCARFNIKAVYQIHHGSNQLIHHSMAALYVVRDLPPEYIGIMPDAGNQFFEAHENWHRAIITLDKYMAAFGVKDGKYEYNPDEKTTESKGWKKEFAPCQEGVNNWYDIIKALKKIDFDGVLNFQPFYHENEHDKLVVTLKKELSYIKNIMKHVENETRYCE